MFQTRFFEPVLQLLFTMFGSVEMVVTGLNTIASSVNCIKNEIKIRVSTVIPQKVSRTDRRWLIGCKLL